MHSLLTLFGRSNVADYANYMCDSPGSGGTPESSDSEGSMRNNVAGKTPSPPIPQSDSLGTTTADQIERLSLNHRSPSSRSCGVGHGLLSATQASVHKRPASSEFYRPPGRRSPIGASSRPAYTGALRDQRTSHRPQKRGSHAALKFQGGHQSSQKRSWLNYHDTNPTRDQVACPVPIARDSGYVSNPSRDNTLHTDFNVKPKDDEYVSVEPLSNSGRILGKDEAHHYVGGVSLVRSKSRWPGLILQPESSPISQDQLAAEVKGIYGGLVMVEAKCINIDAAQAADPNSSLGPEQWQALIALHRTLLYEHHDFLMATQHPSATPALRGLAQKYSMPARMWRHGIHAFLEVLRHRRPQSQDYMVSFVYLAYQMMALLFETVPSFTDTWIECLGDLARYRMAIEEDKEIHAIWGGVAASWYKKASNRHPSIGRLYHHLGILERPGIRKLFLYSKSLTCVIPFPNARDSLGTLCSPLAQEEHSGQANMRTVEARVVKLHACNFINPKDIRISRLASDACSALYQCSTTDLQDTGVFIIIANIAALFERGSPNNILWQLYGDALNADIQSSRPSAAVAELHLAGTTEDSRSSPVSGTSAHPLIYDFYCSSFLSLIGRGRITQTNKATHRLLHAILVWLHSLQILRSKLKQDDDRHTLSPLVTPDRFPWVELCTVLNIICRDTPIDPQIMECARQDIFPKAVNGINKPLLEDYQLRGLVWTQWSYPEDYFGEPDACDEEHMEPASSAIERTRVDRIHWLALSLAFHGEHIKYNSQTASFGISSPPEPLHVITDEINRKPTVLETFTHPRPPKSKSPSASSTSPQSDSDGYLLVEAPRSKSTKTWASIVSASNKNVPRENAVRIVDDEEMQDAI